MTQGTRFRPPAQWRPSKFELYGCAVRASTNRGELSLSSRIIADLVGEFYSRTIPKWVSGDLADLGCGKAPLLGAYGPYCDSAVLADWGNSMHENTFLDLSVDLNLPLRDFHTASFDVVLLSDVLEHIRQPALLISEIGRILRPGGRLILNVPFMYQIHEVPYDYYRYTRFALEHLAREAGLEVVEVAALGGIVEVLGDLCSKTLVSAKLSPLAWLINHVVLTFHRTSLGRKIADRSGRIVPIGYGLIARRPQA